MSKRAGVAATADTPGVGNEVTARKCKVLPIAAGPIVTLVVDIQIRTSVTYWIAYGGIGTESFKKKLLASGENIIAGAEARGN